MSYQHYASVFDDDEDLDPEDVISHVLDDDEILNICPDCNGSGEGQREGSTCPYCRGKGTV